MKQAKFLLLLLFTSFMISCGTTRTVPLTGRKQNILVSDQQILALSNQQYREFMNKAAISTNASQTALVKRVGTRLSQAVENFFRSNGMNSELNQYAWEFNLVRDKQANAFCMPGGKIAVFDGILPYTQDEASLAIVLGHEIAHAIAHHAQEQLSAQMRQQLGTQILGNIVGSTFGNGVGQLSQVIAQEGLQFYNLKFSRQDEMEADRMGIILAAMAGYDPQAAIPFWERMSGGNKNRSDILSTHPSDSKRIAALQRAMPEALQYYHGKVSPAKGKTKTQKSKTKRRSKEVDSVSADQLYKTMKKK